MYGLSPYLVERYTLDALGTFLDGRDSIASTMMANLTPEARERSIAEFAGTYSRKRRFVFLFKNSLPEDDQLALLNSALRVSARLDDPALDRSEYIGGTEVDDSLWREMRAKRDAVVLRFEGVPLLLAYALSFGYPVDEVTVLRSGEVRRVFDFIEKVPVQIPLAAVREHMATGVDAALVASLHEGVVL
jgi:hypothetical protein